MFSTMQKWTIATVLGGFTFYFGLWTCIFGSGALREVFISSATTCKTVFESGRYSNDSLLSNGPFTFAGPSALNLNFGILKTCSSGSIYLNNLIPSLIQMATAPLVGYAINSPMGRRGSIVVFAIITGLSVFAAFLLDLFSLQKYSRWPVMFGRVMAKV